MKEVKRKEKGDHFWRHKTQKDGLLPEVKATDVDPPNRSDAWHQIFIRLPSGKSSAVWVSDQETVVALKAEIEHREGIPRRTFYLLHEGKVLQEDSRISEYHISKNSSISVMHRLRGGAESKRGPSFTQSYKEVVHPKGGQPAASSKGPLPTATPSAQASPYLVEKLETTPILEIKNP